MLKLYLLLKVDAVDSLVVDWNLLSKVLALPLLTDLTNIFLGVSIETRP